MAWIFLALSLPLSIAVSSIFFFSLLGVYVLGAAWVFRRWRPEFGLTEKIFLFFLAVTLASGLLGGDPLASFRRLGKDAYFLIFWLTVSCAIPFAQAERLKRWLIVGSVVSAVIGLLQYAIGMNQYSGGNGPFYQQPAWLSGWPDSVLRYLSLVNTRAVGTRSHPLTYAEGLLLGLAFPLASFVRAPRQRWGQGGVVLVLIGGVVVSGSRGPWLALGVMGLLAVLLAAPKRGVAAIVLLALPVCMLVISSGFRERLRTIGDPAYFSNAERLRMWKAGLAMWRDHPLLGVGPGQVKRVSSLYQEPRDKAEGPWGHLHNTYVHLAAERGAAGLGAFFLLIGVFLRRLERAWKDPDEHVRELALAGLLALVGFLFCGLTEMAYNDAEVLMTLYFCLGLALAPRKPPLIQ